MISRGIGKNVHNFITTKTVLLPPKEDEYKHKKTLILDLDETCAHSSFGAFKNSNFKRKIKYEGATYTIHVLKRPHLDTFLERMSKLYEIVFYTASVKEYANLVIDYIDPNKYGSARLFREDCRQIEGSFVKALDNLGRDLKQTVIIDNSPIAYCLNPDNGLPIKSFYDDINDEELLNIIPILEHLANVDDVQKYIREQIEWLDPEHTELVPKTQDKPPTQLKNQLKYFSEEVEDYKEDLEAFDNNLRIEDINESVDINVRDINDVEGYRSGKRKKPQAMISHYNEISSITPTPSFRPSRNSDCMQIGQGTQGESDISNRFPILKLKSKKDEAHKENLRYKSVHLKNPLLEGSPLISTHSLDTRGMIRHYLVYFTF